MWTTYRYRLDRKTIGPQRLSITLHLCYII